jgi:hypothetical protein
VVEQLGHTNAMVTLGIYAQLMSVNPKDCQRLRALVGDIELAEPVVEVVRMRL